MLFDYLSNTTNLELPAVDYYCIASFTP